MKCNNKEIPISKAKDIAKEYDYDMCIIIGIQNDSSGHISTYGKDKKYCKIAGHIGQKKLGDYIFGDDGMPANMNVEDIVKGDNNGKSNKS